MRRAAQTLTLLGASLAGCGAPPPPGQNMSREVLATDLELDLTTMTGAAKITVAPSMGTALSFEVGDLNIIEVAAGGAPLEHHVVPGTAGQSAAVGSPFGPARLDIGVPVSTSPVEVTITYAFQPHHHFDGWLPATNDTLLWPYFCSNLFPCHPETLGGTTFAVNVTGVPDGETAVYPSSIPAPAPPYMLALTVGHYTYHEIGVTTKGTHVGYYQLPQEEVIAPKTADIIAATSKLADIFNWYETTLGDYSFGDHVGSVQVLWGVGALAGMEHHPFWHLGAHMFSNESFHAHEAAHGWFGDGVRMKCWEDYVLSEGTVSYLTTRVLEVTEGKSAADYQWALLSSGLSGAISQGDTQAWPQTCNQIDLLHDPLNSYIPYAKGAFFYKAIADQIGVDALDQILGAFYRTYVGRSASMGDMIAFIQAKSGYDPTPQVNAWLLGLGDPRN
jgi:aminopeptidase N